MDNQPLQEPTNPLQSPGPQEDETWSGSWRLLIMAFILLIVICGYRLYSVDGNLIGDVASQYLAIATILVGVCLGGRMTVRNFGRGVPIDKRTFNWSRSDRGT